MTSIVLAVLVLGVAPGFAPPAHAQAEADSLYDASTTTDELFAMARDAFGLKRYALAQRYYEAILLRDRADIQAMLELSTVYERSGKLEYARGLLIRATRIDPNYPAIERRRAAVDDLLKIALTEQTDSLLATGSCDEAMPKLSLHLSIEPNNPAVHYKRAMCLFEMGRYDAAQTDVEAAITISPQEPYFVLRDRIINGRRNDEIRQLVSQAATLATSDNPRNREQALDLLGRILELEPGHAWAENEFRRLSEPGAVAQEPAPVEGPDAFSDAVRAGAGAVVTLGRFIERHIVPILAFFAVVIVFRSPLTRAVGRKLAPASLLDGQLPNFSVAEVLTLLNAEPHTGVLEVRGAGCHGSVYVDNGEPRHCTAGKLEGVEALKFLVANARQGRFRFREGATTVACSINTPLSLLLVEQAHRTSGAVPRPGVPGAPAKKSKMKELLDSRL